MMKPRLVKALGLACYLVTLGLLFRLDWSTLFKPKPFFSVLLGMLLLTACQYRKGFTKEDAVVGLRWNVIFSGFLTTLISVFSSADARFSDIGSLLFAEHLLPLLYGSILYLLLGILSGGKPAGNSEDGNGAPADLTYTRTAEKVFSAFSLTMRECHVAQKLLQDMPNKEIAADLYISEATVKKHIQNIYQKFGASSRTSFREIYFDCARNAGDGLYVDH